MSITLNQLYESIHQQFKMKILAGHEYMNREVAGVYYMEDIDISNWTRSGELIMTTAMKSAKDSRWLRNFIDSLLPYHPSGILLNEGAYIEIVPEEVIAYCEEKKLPLITFPWEVYLQDVNQRITNLIFQEEQKKYDMESGILNAIFLPEEVEGYEICMKKLGLDKEQSIQIMLVDCASEKKKSAMQYFWRLILKKWDKVYVVIYKENYIFLLYGIEDVALEDMILEAIKQCKREFSEVQLTIGVGNQVENYTQMYESYQKAKACQKMSRRQKKEMVIFDQLEIVGLLMSCEKKDLQVYYEKQLGALIDYDKENKTEYVAMLEIYMKHSGNTSVVAEKLFVHRNTVTYRLKKIEQILGTDLNDMHELLKYQMALYIPYFI